MTYSPENLAFQQMLSWLDDDKSVAAARYEAIRVRLVRAFKYRGCFDGESLADKVFDRVMNKSREFFETYQGAPEPYFYAVARNVVMEELRKPHPESLPKEITADGESEKNDAELHICLDRCLNMLDDESRQFILEYYNGDGAEKIEQRRTLANKMGTDVNSIRVRAFRLRAKLQKCVKDNFPNSN
ncbi:MAG: RNA polymerase sigma factor [Pyrinomonadaceae bacterium]